MKVTVLYESMFGNTHEVAHAISEGVREAHSDADVQCVAVADVAPELVKSTDLLVVGAPTHIRGMTSGFSRKLGVSGEEKVEADGSPPHEMEEDAEGPGVREWFDGLTKVKDGGPAAAFDTRLPSAMAGGAARGIARRLRRYGYYLVSDPEGFIVDDAYGPLRAGEIERAKQWGAQLVRATVGPQSNRPMATEGRPPERLLESILESNEPPAADRARWHDALPERSPGPVEPPELRVEPSELVLWRGWVGLFYNDILIVTTRRVIFRHGSAWTVLRLSEIDSVDVSHVQLSLTTRGIIHTVDFRKKEVANEVARIIFQNMMRL
jgi:hypothetical protein